MTDKERFLSELKTLMSKYNVTIWDTSDWVYDGEGEYFSEGIPIFVGHGWESKIVEELFE